VVRRGASRALPIVIVNRGETEADHLAAAKVDAGIGDTLPRIVDGLLS
jgi:hypothetical protein